MLHTAQEYLSSKRKATQQSSVWSGVTAKEGRFSLRPNWGKRGPFSEMQAQMIMLFFGTSSHLIHQPSLPYLVRQSWSVIPSKMLSLVPPRSVTWDSDVVSENAKASKLTFYCRVTLTFKQNFSWEKKKTGNDFLF